MNKNLFVITLLFLAGCSQNFKYVLNCELSKVTQTGIIKTQETATIQFNDITVGSSVFYNLSELKIVRAPDENFLLNSNLHAERIYRNAFGGNRHYLQIDTH